MSDKLKNTWTQTEPKLRGNPAIVTEIKHNKEFRIANQGIEDVADYKGYYERLKKKNTKNPHK